MTGVGEGWGGQSCSSRFTGPPPPPLAAFTSSHLKCRNLAHFLPAALLLRAGGCAKLKRFSQIADCMKVIRESGGWKKNSKIKNTQKKMCLFAFCDLFSSSQQSSCFKRICDLKRTTDSSCTQLPSRRWWNWCLRFTRCPPLRSLFAFQQISAETWRSRLLFPLFSVWVDHSQVWVNRRKTTFSSLKAHYLASPLLAKASSYLGSACAIGSQRPLAWRCGKERGGVNLC